MAANMFLSVFGIKGESVHKKHKDEIEVLGWMWRGNQFGSMHAGAGGGSGKASFDDLVLRKPVDRSSPNLFAAMSKGEHIKDCVLVVRKPAGKDDIDYIRLAMTDCIISSVVVGGEAGSEELFEQVSINFAKFKLEYAPVRADGSKAPHVSMKFDIAKNSEE